MAYSWEYKARLEQVPPDDRDWQIWLYLAGRGSGKTRSAAEWCIQQAQDRPGTRGHLVARTAADARDTMIEGDSGIVRISPPWFRPDYEPSKRRITWPNGSQATIFTADEPNLLRGPQCHWWWADELAAWRYTDAWDQLQYGARLGQKPQGVISTTPRPRKIVLDLLKDPSVAITRGSTYRNADNLAPAFLETMRNKYDGTTLGRQELHAEVFTEAPGALWTRAMIEATRGGYVPSQFSRVVVAIDPAVSNNADSDEHGIVVAALGNDKRAYVLEDATLRGSPSDWARKAIALYHAHKADRIVAEANNGGDMVRHTIETIAGNIPVTLVHATRGKTKRAEPISALYEQGRVAHVRPFPLLEDQLCSYTGADSDDSPDRLDALVWALTELMIGAVVLDLDFKPMVIGGGQSQWAV